MTPRVAADLLPLLGEAIEELSASEDADPALVALMIGTFSALSKAVVEAAAD